MAQTEATAHESDENIYRRIGQLTRTLHDALRELGYERELMDARDNLPGARDRLAYIARVTGEAAEKVLNAVDRARTVQQELTEQADSLRNRWQAVAAYALRPASSWWTRPASSSPGSAARQTEPTRY